MAQSNVAPSDQPVATDWDNCSVALSVLTAVLWKHFQCPRGQSGLVWPDWGQLPSSLGMRRYTAVGVSWLQGHGNTSAPCLVVLPPPTCDREISVKPLSTTRECCERRKPVEGISNGEYMASLERGTEAIRCDLPPGVVCNSCWIFWKWLIIASEKGNPGWGATGTL